MVRNIPISLMIQQSFNDALLRVSLESSSAFIGVLSIKDYQFIYVNPRGFEIFGYSSLDEFNKSLKNKPFRKSDNYTETREFRNQKIKDGSTYCETNQFLRADGSIFWGELSINYFETDGEEYFLKRINDISSNKQTEDKLVEVEARCEAIFQHAAIGVILVNQDREIILANDYTETLFGYKNNELIGYKLDILIPESIRERHRTLQKSYMHSPTTRPMGVGLDLQAQRKDGSLFPVEISLSYFSDKNQSYYVAFVNDATFKKKSEETLVEKSEEIKKLNEYLESEVIKRTEDLVKTMHQLEESKNDLEKALTRERELGELKSRFVSMASHEFRTPLTTINSAAALIQKFTTTEDQEKREKYLVRIKSAIGNLTDILEEFLSVGKLEEGKVEARYDTFDLTELVEEIMNDMKSMLKNDQSFDYQHIGDKTVVLDKSLLRKIIINLSSNAIKFSPESKSIEIRTNVNDYIELSIADKGIGISEEDQKHLFDRFFRGANVTNVQVTGFGLHLVARYNVLMGGQVEIKSKLGEVTIIKMTFPR